MGASGLVIATDLALPMLRVAQGKIAGLPVRAVVMDGQALACRAESVDVVLCQLGLMFFPDAGRGLREFRRVLRPHGRLAVQVWSVPERVHYMGMLADALSPYFADQRDDLYAPTRLADPARLHALLAGAGFRDVSVVAATQEIAYDSFDQYWSGIEAGGGRLAQFYVQLPADARRAVRAQVSARMAPLESAGRLILSGEALIGVGRALAGRRSRWTEKCSPRRLEGSPKIPSRRRRTMGMSNQYDAIVVGARCAGAPTAMLLAQKGHRVLLVDKATFPSDTISTHIIHPPGVAALERWSLSKPLKATGCPPIAKYAFDFGPFTIAGPLRPVDGTAYALCPRRTVLDKMLVDAAVRAGAELQEGFAVDEVLVENDAAVGIRGHLKGGGSTTHRAEVIVGADGRHSLVAKAVRAECYNERPVISVGYYTYWSGLPTNLFEGYIRPRAAFGLAATHDGQTLTVISWPRADFDAVRSDVGGRFLRVDRSGARGRRAHSPREARGAVRGHGRSPQLLPQTVWSRLGADRRRRLPQGPHHRSRHQRRLPRRRGPWRRRSTTCSRAAATSTRRWRPINARATRRRCRSTTSPASSRTWRIRRRPRCSSSSGDSTNPQASSDFLSTLAGIVPAPEFFAPDDVGRILGQAERPATS